MTDQIISKVICSGCGKEPEFGLCTGDEIDCVCGATCDCQAVIFTNASVFGIGASEYLPFRYNGEDEWVRGYPETWGGGDS